MSLVELFCDVDDFCQAFMPKYHQMLVAAGQRQRRRTGELCMSEIMTILIGFHQSHYRDFKAYYLEQVCKHQRTEFPRLVSYERFVELTPGALMPLCGYLRCLFGACTGISFIDSTPLAVCHNVTTLVSASTRCLLGWHDEASLQPAGFLGSKCMWSLTTGANC